MNKQYRWLELKIDNYLNYLAKPNPKLNGWAICPHVGMHRNKIQISIVDQGIKQPITQSFELLQPLKLMAIVMAFPKKPAFGKLQNCVDELLNLPEHDGIECLLVNHKLKGKWRGVYTGFDHCDLIIIQDRHKLYWARQNLKKRGYYNQKNELG